MHPASLFACRADGSGERVLTNGPAAVRGLLAVWLAPDTECVKPVLADGTPVHLEPLASRYTKPRTVQRDRWFGTGVLKLARPGFGPALKRLG